MSGILIAGFGAIGKTTLSKKYKNIIDLESSSFKYIIDDELKRIPIEERKGLKTRKLNPEFPNNYYTEIVNNLEKHNIVLISMHNEIINLLEENNINYYVVYPEEDMLNEIIERCKARGNKEEFLAGVKEAYYRLYPHKCKNVIWMKKGQYLEEVLVNNDLLGNV
jgi:tRNA uridine 5-carbamoylmethylation protein Kti12